MRQSGLAQSKAPEYFRPRQLISGYQGELSGVLLGDEGYACLTFLLTPFADPQTAGQHKNNVAHARTGAHIEMAFGLLKSRFQCFHHLRCQHGQGL
ncbi:hypothetical protein CRENBAI_001363 [Crenichthys baileyi]|uniref:DDE Tnp4 domain-containing protein n=1 Tax=Crenichthys baileyi TaxID=28760 RepID=A0AAV9QUQ9_9TELE